MLSVKQIKKGLRHPSLAFHLLNRALYYGDGNSEGINIFSKDWDNLIILDACRYDYFESVVLPQLNGNLHKEISKGSATREWIEQNFSNQELHDTVYVTANGWYRHIRDEIGSSIHDAAWLYGETYRNERGTVEPQVVTEKAIEFAEKYPDKRLITHFVQPHKPYIGPTAESKPWTTRNINLVEFMSNSQGVSDSTLQTMYRETLECVIPSLSRLVNQLNGKTVITSDHGELLGERYPHMPLKNYGHPIGIYVPELVEVPWFECRWDERRQITADRPKNQYGDDTADLEEHLRIMGYK